MRKIPYETLGFQCLTPCHNARMKDGELVLNAKVGSATCQECVHNAETTKTHVYCTRKGPHQRRIL